MLAHKFTKDLGLLYVDLSILDLLLYRCSSERCMRTRGESVAKLYSFFCAYRPIGS
jgi:hypothetical protein